MLRRIKMILQELKNQQLCKKQGKSVAVAEYTDEFTANIPELTEKEKEKIKLDADRLLTGEYQIYNYDVYQLTDWLKDPVSGKKVSSALCTSLIRTSALVNNTDVKNYWEQSHLHPVITLAQAYLITNNQKYAEKVKTVIFDFDDNNICGKTVCWKCVMDVAIRICNMVYAVSLIKESEAYKGNADKLTSIIAEHTAFVANNYEDKGKYPNNHYLSDITGVIFGSVFLFRTRQSKVFKSYLDDALQRLEKEAGRQINVDGTDYESSTYYHCFVTELLCEIVGLLESNNISFSDSIKDKADKALGVAEYLGGFSESLPLIGDQDGSRLFHWFGCFDVNRCNFSSLKRFSKKNGLFGLSGLGLYVIEKGNWKVFFKCGDIGTSSKGTHDHNDQLSVCVLYNGMSVVVDSGTYCYTSSTEERKAFRSVRAHSTAFFGDREQNDISSVFAIGTHNIGKILKADENMISGEFVYSDNTIHRRTVSIEDDRVIISDEAVGASGKTRFIISPDFSIEKSGEAFALTKDGQTVLFKTSYETEKNNCEVSCAYGIKEASVCIDVELTQTNKTVIEVVK